MNPLQQTTLFPRRASPFSCCVVVLILYCEFCVRRTQFHRDTWFDKKSLRAEKAGSIVLAVVWSVDIEVKCSETFSTNGFSFRCWPRGEFMAMYWRLELGKKNRVKSPQVCYDKHHPWFAVRWVITTCNISTKATPWKWENCKHSGAWKACYDLKYDMWSWVTFDHH